MDIEKLRIVRTEEVVSSGIVSEIWNVSVIKILCVLIQVQIYVSMKERVQLTQDPETYNMPVTVLPNPV